MLFSEVEFTSAISKCNNSSTHSPNKLSQRHLKTIINDPRYLRKFVDITDACFKLGYCPLHFKTLTSIIIPKSNKESYNSPKSFRSIVLLNMISKIIENVFSKRLQFYLISNNFIYLSQLDRLKQCLTVDTGVSLTYFIYSEQVKNVDTSTLVFDIAQFFPSLNHQLLLYIFDKAEFDPKVLKFFKNYLVGQKTKYVWNSFSSSLFNVDVGVGQGLALSTILSTLYIALVLYIFENQLKSLKIPISFLSFVNNKLLVSQNKLSSVLNSFLFYSYQIISSLLDKFGLKLEYKKTKVFHFLRSTGLFNFSSLNLSPLGGLISQPKNLQRYLGFIFNRKLIFCSHINFYANKVISIVKYMKLLGNSTHDLILIKSIFCIEVVFSPLHYIVSSCCFITKCCFHILSRNLTKCNEELPYESQAYSVLSLF